MTPEAEKSTRQPLAPVAVLVAECLARGHLDLLERGETAGFNELWTALGTDKLRRQAGLAWRLALAAIASAVDREGRLWDFEDPARPEVELLIREFDDGVFLPFAKRTGLAPRERAELRRRVVQECGGLLAAADEVAERALPRGIEEGLGDVWPLAFALEALEPAASARQLGQGIAVEMRALHRVERTVGALLESDDLLVEGLRFYLERQLCGLRATSLRLPRPSPLRPLGIDVRIQAARRAVIEALPAAGASPAGLEEARRAVAALEGEPALRGWLGVRLAQVAEGAGTMRSVLERLGEVAERAPRALGQLERRLRDLASGREEERAVIERRLSEFWRLLEGGHSGSMEQLARIERRLWGWGSMARELYRFDTCLRTWQDGALWAATERSSGRKTAIEINQWQNEEAGVEAMVRFAVETLQELGDEPLAGLSLGELEVWRETRQGLPAGIESAQLELQMLRKLKSDNILGTLERAELKENRRNYLESLLPVDPSIFNIAEAGDADDGFVRRLDCDRSLNLKAAKQQPILRRFWQKLFEPGAQRRKRLAKGGDLGKMDLALSPLHKLTFDKEMLGEVGGAAGRRLGPAPGRRGPKGAAPGRGRLMLACRPAFMLRPVLLLDLRFEVRPGGELQIDSTVCEMGRGGDDAREISHYRECIARDPADAASGGPPEALGAEIYRSLLVGSTAGQFSYVRSRADETRACAYVRLRYDRQSEDVAGLPWELLYDHREERFLLDMSRVHFTRYRERHGPEARWGAPPALQLLLAVAGDAGDMAWKRGKELLRVLEYLQSSSRRLQFEAALPVSFEGLMDALGPEIGRPHVVHLEGSGVLRAGQPELYFPDGHGQVERVTVAELEGALTLAGEDLGLLVLNTPLAGAESRAARGVLGLALRQNLPAVLVVEEELPERWSARFFCRFYESILRGQGVAESLYDARTHIRRCDRWYAPTIYMRTSTPDLALLREASW